MLFGEFMSTKKSFKNKTILILESSTQFKSASMPKLNKNEHNKIDPIIFFKADIIKFLFSILYYQLDLIIE